MSTPGCWTSGLWSLRISSCGFKTPGLRIFAAAASEHAYNREGPQPIPQTTGSPREAHPQLEGGNAAAASTSGRHSRPLHPAGPGLTPAVLSQRRGLPLVFTPSLWTHQQNKHRTRERATFLLLLQPITTDSGTSNNRIYFLTVLEGRSLISRCRQG